MLEVGDRFPVERLPVKLGAAGAILFFYPADLTPGCTMEAQAFNDRYDKFRDAGYEVIGVSIDSDERHEEFREECGLRFPLASDEGGVLAGSLDLLKEYEGYGTYAKRVTYLLDADGIVQRVWDVSDAGEHPEEVLVAVTSE